MSLPSPITFASITGVVPCEPFTFTFSYNETDKWHVEGATNTLATWVGNASSGTVLQTLSNGDVVYPAYSGWQVGWNPVIAGAGEYFIAAAVTSDSNATYTTTSQLFSIVAGTDNSCSTAAATATAGRISTVQTTRVSFATGTPVGASLSSTERIQLTRGAMAGMVIGIITILFGLLAAIIFVRRRRVARAQKPQVPELPAYATVVRVGQLMVQEEKKDLDGTSELGPPLDYDLESLRSVPPSYHHGDV